MAIPSFFIFKGEFAMKNDFLSKVKSNVGKTAVAVKEQSAVTLEKMKINASIVAAKSEMSKILRKMSSRYYEMWKNEKVDFDEIDRLCQQALDKEELILSLKDSIKHLKKNEKSHFDESLAEAAASAGAASAAAAEDAAEEAAASQDEDGGQKLGEEFEATLDY
jgi:hypothetical protein